MEVAKMNCKNTLLAILTIGLLPACIADVTETDHGIPKGKTGSQLEPMAEGDEMPEVARVEYDDGTLVRFHEAVPGVIMIVQVGNAGKRPIVSKRDLVEAGPVQLYEELTGDIAPTELINAQERSTRPYSGPEETGADLTPPAESRNVDPVSITPVQDPRTSVQKSGVLDGECITNTSSNHRSEWEFVTNTLDWTVKDVDKFSGQTACHSGRIRYGYRVRRWFQWSGWGRIELTKNQYATINYYDPELDYDFDVNLRVDEASGSNDLYTACHYAWDGRWP